MNDAFEKNNSEEKSILDKMSLIDYQFVEEAQYPSSNVNISKKNGKDLPLLPLCLRQSS